MKKKSVLWKKWIYPKKRKWDFIQHYLEQNNVQDKDLYFEKPYPEWLNDENLLPDIQKAIIRIITAINAKEKIVIFWDYDCDWIPWTAICVETISNLWWLVSYRIPDREKDWYWLKKYFIDEMKAAWVWLIITVDNWIAAFEPCEYAKELWLDVIVTDHHEVMNNTIPDVYAVINPHRADSVYPFKQISWACVAWKLMIALAKRIRWKTYSDKEVRDKYVDLVALSTVTDIMPLIWENRVIVDKWLKIIKKTKNEWLKELFRIMELEPDRELDSEFFWFELWPRINASWRMSSPYFALQLLLWKIEFAQVVNDLNLQRKQITSELLEKIIKDKAYDNEIIVLAEYGWKPWVIWLIAWKITEYFWLPSIVILKKEGKSVWSCRAPLWFNIFEFISDLQFPLVEFWWHAQACWFTIDTNLVEEFTEIIYKKWRQRLQLSPIENIMEIKYEILKEELNMEFAKSLKILEPFWYKNSKPTFLIRWITPGKIDTLWSDANHITMDIWWTRWVGFGFGGFLSSMSNWDRLDLAINLRVKKWRWEDQLEVHIKDVMIHKD